MKLQNLVILAAVVVFFLVANSGLEKKTANTPVSPEGARMVEARFLQVRAIPEKDQAGKTSFLDVYYAMSDVRARQGRAQEAITIATNANRMFPADAPRIFNGLIRTFELRKDEHSAKRLRELFAPNQDLKGSSKTTRVGAGDEGDMPDRTAIDDEVVRLFREAIKQDPKDASAYSGLGSCMVSRGRPDEAEKLFLKAIELDPKKYNAYSGLGNLMMNSNRLNEAEKFYNKAIELNPTAPISYVGLGIVMAKRERWKDARRLFEKSLELDLSDEIDPSHNTAREGLSLLREDGHY